MQICFERENTKQIQKDMFGLFFEDINYGLDGGLYAEMLENRTFEFQECRGSFNAFYQLPAYRYGWNAYPVTGGAYLEICDESPLNQVNPHYLRAVVYKAGDGFCNKAYDGIAMKAGVACKVSFYAKGDAKLQICIQSPEEEFLVESEVIEVTGDTWQKYETMVVSPENIRGGIFAVQFTEPGICCFDYFSMMPEDAVCGLFRKDLAEMLKALKPGFLRYPGGCIVEGAQLSNRYQWKLTVGPLEERKTNWNRWAVHTNDGTKLELSPWPYYHQTYGVGFYEYFILCEYLGCKAVPVLNVGLACQYQSKELVPSDTPEFQEFVQDAVDLIEFANGDVTTKWGALRAQMGHPEPFGMEYIGIGNEQWETEEVDFFHRYDCFEKAIHEKYPEIKVLGSAGPDVGTERHKAAWDFYEPILKENAAYAYAVDEHYYVPDIWLYEHVHMYDDYDRTKKVFAGEYACHIRPDAPWGERNTFDAALAEAAFMTGLERNCDLVLLASYAPLFARIGYAQWQPDMIWFDDTKAYGSPSYYVQQIYTNYTGDTLLPVKSDCDNEAEKLYITASCDSTSGKTFVKLINAGDKDQKVVMDGVKGEVKIITLKADLDAFNSIAEPCKVAPVEAIVDVTDGLTVAAGSIVVVIA